MIDFLSRRVLAHIRAEMREHRLHPLYLPAYNGQLAFGVWRQQYPQTSFTLRLSPTVPFSTVPFSPPLACKLVLRAVHEGMAPRDPLVSTNS